jgi:hypothetical protein
MRWQVLRLGEGVEKTLKDEYGGDLVDEAAVLLAGVTGFREDVVGFERGEALVVEVNRDVGGVAELLGEGLGLGGLGAGEA